MASGFVAKEWKQRISEFATRRLLSIVSQSSSSITVDVSRQEGLVSQVGDAFSPENMNGLEQRIAGAFANVDADVTAAKKSASDGKTLIAAAITAKKVAASGSDTFAVLAQKIGKIVLGSGNATKADVLAGKTFTNNDGVQYTGTMPNRGSFGFSSVNTTGSGAAGYYSVVTVDTRPSYTAGYKQGVTDADGRANANSVNYKTGYNKGVTDADARANPASVNYKSGYTAGQNDAYFYKVVSLSGLNTWADSLTLKSSSYGISASKCVAMYLQISNIRNAAGDADSVVTYSYSNGVLTASFPNGLARPNGSTLIIIYKK